MATWSSTDVAVFRDAHGVDFEDVEAALLVGKGDFNLAVEAAGAHKGGVKRV